MTLLKYISRMHIVELNDLLKEVEYVMRLAIKMLLSNFTQLSTLIAVQMFPC